MNEAYHKCRMDPTARVAKKRWNKKDTGEPYQQNYCYRKGHKGAVASYPSPVYIPPGPAMF